MQMYYLLGLLIPCTNFQLMQASKNLCFSLRQAFHFKIVDEVHTDAGHFQALTTVLLIQSIRTVIVTITDPGLLNTIPIMALEH